MGSEVNVNLIGKRKRERKTSCANPLFMRFLEEWRADATAKGTKMQYVYAKAISSLKKFPVPAETGQELKILNGFGDKICGDLQKKLDEFRSSHGDIDPSDFLDDNDVTARPTASGTKPKGGAKTGSAKGYIPSYRSGPYAIVLTLYNELQKSVTAGYLTKKELLVEAQPLADNSFTIPDPGSRYVS